MSLLTRVFSSFRRIMARIRDLVSSRIARSLLGASFATFVHVFLFVGVGDFLEPWSLEVWFNVRGPQKAPEDIVLIAMDEDSYEELDLPMSEAWPRVIHAELLDRLAAAGAKVVAFDVVFAGPSDDPEGDKDLAEALHGLPTIIGIQMDNPTGTAPGTSNQLIYPYEPFQKQAKLALVGLPQEEDMILRFKTSRDAITKGYPTLSEAAAGELNGTGPAQQDFIWYYGPPESDSIKVVPYYTALDPEEEPDSTFKDKIVFVGLWMQTGFGPTQKDTFSSPFWHKSTRQGAFTFERSRVFGVEVHATAAANLINQEWIRRSAFFNESVWLGVGTFCLSAAITYVGPFFGALALVVSMALWCFFSYNLFLAHFFLPGVVAALVLVGYYTATLILYYLSSYRAQKYTLQALSMYLSPELAKEASKNQEVLKLGGTRRRATALFTDIADFTSISEAMEAEEVGNMLNDYFTSVMEVVQKNGGMLNKFIGDAIFAIWGAPNPMEDHGEKAVLTALAIERGVKEFNAIGKYPVLHTRIGVHTGDMIIGNLGTKTKLDYTAIGDSVNLASRLEGINKYFGTTILVSATAASQVTSPYLLTRMGWVAVKGKEEAVVVYTIFDPPLSRTVEAGWREAQDEFRTRGWDRADEIFVKIKEIEPRLAVACELYLENIRGTKGYKEMPPRAEWQGAISFDSK